MRAASGRAACLAALLLAIALPALAATGPAERDVRQIRVGAKLDEGSAAGLSRFSCAGGDAQKLGGWSDFRRCPADAAGLRQVRFEFEEDKDLARLADRWEGTKIAGHPVILTLAVSDGGTVEALRIASDPKTSPYLRKKAYLLSLRVREHYGIEGWSCADLPRQEGETEIGGMFIKQECSKTVDGRSLRMLTKLFRGAGQEGKAYEDSVTVEVTRAPPS
jgi:hypothetical protein